MGFKHRLMAGLLTITASAAILVGTTAPAHAAPYGPVPMMTSASLRCLDADVGTIGSNGTKIQLWGCDIPNAVNQGWYLDYRGGGHWLIKNGRSGRCLDADAGTIGRNGTKVQLWDCTPATNQFGYALNQVWYRYEANGQSYWVNVDPRGSRRCLDADRGTIGGNGTKIQLWDCTPGAANQDWHY